jgi:hypothetical protein
MLATPFLQAYSSLVGMLMASELVSKIDNNNFKKILLTVATFLFIEKFFAFNIM